MKSQPAGGKQKFKFIKKQNELNQLKQPGEMSMTDISDMDTDGMTTARGDDGKSIQTVSTKFIQTMNKKIDGSSTSVVESQVLEPKTKENKKTPVFQLKIPDIANLNTVVGQSQETAERNSYQHTLLSPQILSPIGGANGGGYKDFLNTQN